ncbi:hypothetical protein ACO0K2_17455 [Undibacterium sp. MH2W]|uniref:hypothetical protein n=1 Tax=Undibacterium sp. MH2W TaxID=3413044 RepID=UPI003BF2080A
MKNTEYFIDEDENGFGRCLVLTDLWRDEFAQVMISNKISNLRLSSSAGWSGKDISFISTLEFLTGIEIYSWNIKDISPIFENKNLRFIGLQCEFTSPADFSKLEKLEVCKVFWRNKIDGLFSCRMLRHLNIVEYPFESLRELSELNALQRLQLSSKKLSTLSGMASLTSLKNLDLANCSNLVDVSELSKCIDLQTLEINGCKKICAFPDSLCLPVLKEVVLVDCGKIVSLRPFSNCKKLTKLRATGDTVITDGNFDFMLEYPVIEDIWYASKSHYSISRELLKKKLQEKQLRTS